jgi:hypothetical protein
LPNLSDHSITVRVRPNIRHRDLDTAPLVQYHMRTRPRQLAASRCDSLSFLFPVLVVATGCIHPVLLLGKFES